MRTELRHNKDYLFLVDKDSLAEIGDYITDSYNIWKWDDNSSLLGRKKVIAYRKLNEQAPDLDLPLLPNPFKEVDVEKLAFNYTLPSGFNRTDAGVSIMKAFIAGYKAATKQFSLEDIKKAIKMARTGYGYDGNIDIEAHLDMGGVDNYNNEFKLKTEEEIIQSLSTQQLPKEFKPIMVCGRCLKPDDDEDCWSAKECSRNTDFPDKFKTITNSEGKQEIQGRYVY